MNPCETYEALLDLYLDGECSAEEAARVQTHIKECSACQAYVDEMLAIRAAFPAVEDTTVPAGFAEGVMAAVRATPQKTKKTPWAKVLLPLAACCAIVILLQDVRMPSMKMAAPQEAAATTESAALLTDMAAPAAEEDAPAAEAPAAAAPEMPAAAKGKSALETEPVVNDSYNYLVDEKTIEPYRIRITVDAGYIGDALAGFTPTVVADLPEGRTELHYELTMAQYEALLEALADRDELPAEEEFETDSDLVLVIVR